MKFLENKVEPLKQKIREPLKRLREPKYNSC